MSLSEYNLEHALKEFLVHIRTERNPDPEIADVDDEQAIRHLIHALQRYCEELTGSTRGHLTV